MSEYPRHRAEGLVIKDAGNEIYVYDEFSFGIHTLPAAAARVWRLCTGVFCIEDIARIAELGEIDVVTLINEMADLDLIEGYTMRTMRRPSRRGLLKKVGFGAAIAVPAIISVTAPTAASGASCPPAGLKPMQACKQDPDCCGGGTSCVKDGIVFICQ